MAVDLRFYVNAVGLCAPGLVNWSAGRSVLTGQAPHQEAPIAGFERLPLPRNEARRASFTIRLALQVAQEALEESGLSYDYSVFACSGGDPDALEKIFTALASPERLVSPNHFINSVHSAPAGYWSIATGSRHPWISSSAYDASFSAGLLEAASLAVAQCRQVLLVAYDVPPPAALWLYRPIRGPFSTALHLSASAQPQSHCRLQLGISARRQEDCMQEASLEDLRAHNPAARSLPLLKLIAQRRAGRVALPYVNDSQLLIAHAPC